MKKERKKKVEFSLETIQNNPVTRKQLEGFVEEVVLAKIKVKAEQEAISDIRGEAQDSLGIPGKILMKLVRENMQAGTIEAEIHELEQVQAISQAIENHGQTTP